MTPRQQLLALFAFVGSVAIGGVSYVAISPRPTTTVVDLQDAGFFRACGPAILSCAVRTAVACRTRPDGGAIPAYLRVQTQVGICPTDAGIPVLAFAWPKVDGGDCFELAGPAEQACSLDDDCDGGGCSWDPSGVQSVTAVQNLCACRNTTTANCLGDRPRRRPAEHPLRRDDAAPGLDASASHASSLPGTNWADDAGGLPMTVDPHLVLEVVISVLGFILAGLMGVASFFLKRILVEHEKVGATVLVHTTELALQKAELGRQPGDIAELRVHVKDLAAAPALADLFTRGLRNTIEGQRAGSE